jgi:hypothetical protein
VSFLYSVYGLRVRANRPVPGLVALPTTPTADVEVALGLMPPWVKEIEEPEREHWYIDADRDNHGGPNLKIWQLAGGEYFRLRYADGTEFVFERQGTQIWATWPDQLTLEDTATYLLGPVLGFVLRLRNSVCLHASAIAFGDQTIAIVGDAGAGKSTTAAAFAQLGYAVLSDDIVPLFYQGQHFLAQPGYPRVRLWPESVSTLYGSPDALPRLTPTWDKRYLDLNGTRFRFQEEPLPLAAVYILGKRRHDPLAPFVEALPPHPGMMALVANTYGNYLLDKAMRAQEFAELSRIVDHVPIRRVTPHCDPAEISKLCQTILADFGKLSDSVPDRQSLSGK